ncbi:hypothetical protein [Pseudomonas sp. UMAB-08]|uniref:hypothetical protein n=1 Tax=Pseudomonas sp. UMAB-08 TaxID=1365375 RepID=UPI001C587F32|nr:hypothetical protein [Pseudomonas sp. UMAB-08]
MDDQKPPGPPPFKPKKPTKQGARPARRDSLTKPGLPIGTHLPTEHSDGAPKTSSTGEMAFTYAHVLRAEDSSSGELAVLISTHLEPPSLEGINPKSVSEAQMKAGINVLIPGSSYLKPGDEFHLLWGSRTYPIQTLDEENINDPIIGMQWVSYSTDNVAPQGKVEVCYDINRDGQRIGTSAILHLNVHSCYRSSVKQRNRGRSIRRKQQRRPPPQH